MLLLQVVESSKKKKKKKKQKEADAEWWWTGEQAVGSTHTTLFERRQMWRTVFWELCMEAEQMNFILYKYFF